MSPREHRDNITWILSSFLFLVVLVQLAAPDAVQANQGQGNSNKRAKYQYISPVPDSRLLSRWNNIILRQGNEIDPSTIDPAALSVIGSESGKHTGELILSDDFKTLVFNPDAPYTPDEVVFVSLKPRIRSITGKPLGPVRFKFHVSPLVPSDSGQVRVNRVLQEVADHWNPMTLTASDLAERTSFGTSTGGCLPPQYPSISVAFSSSPEPGYLFLGPFGVGDTDSRLLILDNLGNPVFFRRFPVTGPALDFKVQPNGLLTSFNVFEDAFGVMDSNYVVLKKIEAGNGYDSDAHDLQLIANGHALLVIYDVQPIPMDTIVPGGNPDAFVAGFIIQELDAAGNVVFQWRSWDHFEITDVASPMVSLTDSTIDYVHGNSVELDHDGNLLISSRHMNEITKINRQTGEVMWRFGGNAKQNEFTILNDPRGFSHQHDARRLPNGNITIFDNGNFLNPLRSRAIEYKLDEERKIAELVWEYHHSPDVYGPFMGSVQRGESGSTLIGWGGTFEDPGVTEVHPDGSVALDLQFGDRLISYRAFRFPWQTVRFTMEPDTLDFGTVGAGESAELPVTIRNTSSEEVTINCFYPSDSSITVNAAVPFTLFPGGSETVEVQFSPMEDGEFIGALYARQVSELELVAAMATVRAGISSSSIGSRPLESVIEIFPTLPNPTRGQAAFSFNLPSRGKTVLEVFDIRGRRLATLVNQVRDPGRHEVTWNSAKLTNGLYILRLQFGDMVTTSKFVLLN